MDIMDVKDVSYVWSRPLVMENSLGVPTPCLVAKGLNKLPSPWLYKAQNLKDLSNENLNDLPIEFICWQCSIFIGCEYPIMLLYQIFKILNNCATCI